MFELLRSQAPLWILLAPLCGAIFIPAIGLYRSRLAFPAAVVFALSFVAAAFFGVWQVMEAGPIPYEMAGWAPPVGIALNLDMLAAFILAVIAAITLLVTIYSATMVPRELPGREVPFYGVMFIMLLGLTGMVLTADLFNLYVFYEVSSLSGYALMAIGHRKAAVSAYRYLLMGTVGASFYLLGLAYLYAMTGSLNMADTAQILSTAPVSSPIVVSLVLMTVGVGLKMALFPMHLWLPDAYTYASSTATAIIAPVMTKVSAYVLLRVMFFVYDARLVDAVPVRQTVTWLALIGVVWGSLLAIAQKDAKRMLAYSSVSQVAYIGVGLGLGSPIALVGAMIHVLNHATMKCSLFMVTGSVYSRIGSSRLRRYGGLGYSMPGTFLALSLAALAMVGIPPTAGFFSKWYLVLGGMQAGQWAVVGVVIASSLLTAVYFFRLLTRAYAPREGEVEVVAGGDVGWSMVAPMLALGFGVLLLGIFNSWFVNDILQHALPAGAQLPEMWHTAVGQAGDAAVAALPK